MPAKQTISFLPNICERFDPDSSPGFWPIQPRDIRLMFDRFDDGFIKYLDKARSDDDCLVLWAASALISGRVRTILELAKLHQAAEESGVSFENQHPVFAFLSGQSKSFDVSLISAPPLPFVKGSLLRRLLRMYTWSGPFRLPQSVFDQKRVVVSHNSFLVSELKRIGAAAHYRYADDFYSAMKPQLEIEEPAQRRAEDLSGAILDWITPSLTPTENLHLVLRETIARTMQDAMDRSVAARSVTDLPEVLYGGSGGSAAGRFLGFEVMRRGGKVVRFDHGGTPITVPQSVPYYLIELLPTSHFVTFSPLARDRLSTNVSGLEETSFKIPELQAGGGDPSFELGLKDAKGPSAPDQPKVLYLNTAFRGIWQYPTPLLSDQIYLRFQAAVMKALTARYSQVAIRPHPEGMLRGHAHPLEDIAHVERRPLAEAVGDYDVLVFDFRRTSSLWQSLCTNKAVVFLDLDMDPVNQQTAQEFEDRVSVVPIPFDDCNVPVLDEAALDHAVRDSMHKRDPSGFRQLLLAR